VVTSPQSDVICKQYHVILEDIRHCEEGLHALVAVRHLLNIILKDGRTSRLKKFTERIIVLVINLILGHQVVIVKFRGGVDGVAPTIGHTNAL